MFKRYIAFQNILTKKFHKISNFMTLNLRSVSRVRLVVFNPYIPGPQSKYQLEQVDGSRRVVRQSKKEPKILLFDPDCPRGKMFAPLYSILHYFWFDMHDCLYKMDFGLFRATPHCPAPKGYIKVLSVFFQSSSIGLCPVKVSRF